jgi:Ca2+-binding RTX toxin-like protein
MIRRLLLVVLLALILPAAARASTAKTYTPDPQIGTKGLSVSGAPGEVNQIEVTYLSSASAAVADLHSTLTAGAGCVSVNAHHATCTTAAGPLDVLSANLGNGNDTFVARTNGHVALASLGVDGGAGDDIIDVSHVAVTSEDRDRQYLVDLEGGPGRDRLRGTSSADSIGGGSARDVLFGGPGNDLLDGDGQGDDEEHPDTPARGDAIDGGPGRDTVSYAAHPHGVTVDLTHPHAAGTGNEDDRLTSIENVIGTRGHDVLRGNGLANELQGYEYELFATSPLAGDSITGRGGADTLIGTSRADSFSGGAGRDMVELGGGVDHVSCGTGTDTTQVADAGLLFPEPGCERLDDGSYAFRSFHVSGGVLRAKLASDNTEGEGICAEELHVTRGGTSLGNISWSAPVPSSLAIHLNAAGVSAAAHHYVVRVGELGCTGSPHSWRLRL